MQGSSGPTTFLFTDIEGSTRLWEQQPERMSLALKHHDVSARAAVERNRGVVVKMVGDGLYAAFDDPLDGLNATLEMQQALSDPAATSGIPLYLRCGLHLGVVERRDDDFFGPPVNRTARLMSVAHGGQILLSAAFAAALDGRLPPGVSLRDLGGVRLRDLSVPEHVFQILHPKLRQDFPALRSLEATPNNLPQLLTTFIGRQHELDAAAEMLRNARLVTLLGMGGLGKTRLSLQIAADALDAYEDGVWFVDLAPIRDASLVPSEVAKTLSVQEEPGRPLIHTLGAHLKSRKTLIILDNCEHLVAACASLANALLQAASGLRIIATSREALRVPGEQVYQVFPMPAPERSDGVEALLRSDAVRLFVDRARLHKATFQLVEAEAPAVAELCARLEGIPLAIELAAARMRTLSVADINARLRDRFKLLTGGGRVLLERQQTLRALVDWSYDLLSTSEQVLFDRLCVFAGGFDLAAAEVVCGIEPLTSDDVLDVLTSLVDKSLVMLDESAAESRYRTLETIRDYAREKLGLRGEADAIAARHCAHFLAMAKLAREGFKGPEQPRWIGRTEDELDNLRAAIALALEGRVDPVLGVKLVVALQSFWLLRGYCTEGRRYVRAALALPAVTASDVAHTHTLYVGAALAAGQGDHAEALRMLEACLELRLRMGAPVDIAATLSTLSLVRLRLGDAAQARENEQQALKLFREIGEPIGEAIGLLHLGEIALHVAEDDEAQRYFEACLAIAKRTNHREIESECERMLGEIALGRGRIDAARARLQRSLDVASDAGDRRDAATSLWWLARVDLACDDFERAAERLAASLKSFRTFEMNEELLGCLEDHARLAQRLGRAEDAAHLFGAALAHRERMALKASPRHERELDEAMRAARDEIGEASFDAAAAHGAQWELDEALRRAAPSVSGELAPA